LSRLSARIYPLGGGSLAAIAAIFAATTLVATLLAANVFAARSAGKRPALPRQAGSAYPEQAQRPSRVVRPSEFARSSSSAPAGTGGASGPSAPATAPTRTSSTTSTKALVPKTTQKKPAKKKPGLHGNPARALLAYQAMQQNFYIPGTGLYEGEPYSYLWPFSQAFAATISVASITGQAASQASAHSREIQARLLGLGKYWASPSPVAGKAPTGEQPEGEETGEGSEPAEAPGIAPPELPSFNGEVVPPGGASYYDDNEWVGIELLRLYKLRHEAASLEKAEQIMAFVMGGWENNPKLACPGGVPFSDAPSNTDRNTVTDGPAAELGAQLFRLTDNLVYLGFAQQAYQWVRSCLTEPNGLYADHIRLHGVIDPTEWSYNQGAMIGAGVLLYQATGNSEFLYQARQTAKAALAYFTLPRLLSENPFFASVYFRNVMYLDAVTHDPPGAKLAQSYIDSVWVHQRLTDNLFAFGSPPSTQLLYQAAVTQIYALLSTSPSTYF
jgi:Glycosyl hydrolase family 76